MEERRVRVGSLFEWGAAAAGVLTVTWLLSAPVQRMIGSGVEAAVADAQVPLPPGVPAGASSIPVMLLLDGREIRQGDLQSRVAQVVPDTASAGPPVRSRSEFGERHTRTYHLDGATFYIVCERTEPGGPMRVAGIYLP